MDDRLELDLRAAARAARAEVEAGLDIDAALASVRAVRPTDLAAAPTIGSPNRRPVVWLAAAAAAAIAVTGGVLLLGSDDEDDSIEIADPATTVIGTEPAATTTLATTAESTVPASTGPASEPTTTVAGVAGSGEPVVRPGTIDVGPDDVIARAVDGDVWWYPGALSGSPGERILLIDRPDERIAPEEGGPNYVDFVAGTFSGSLVYGDCCEPASGQLYAISEPGAEADLWADPIGESDVAQVWGIGYRPRFEPGGTRVVAMNHDVLRIVDLATGARESIASFELGEVGGYEAAWVGDWVAALVWSIDDGLLLTVRDPADLTTEIARVSLGSANDDQPWADIVGSNPNEVVVSIRDDDGVLQQLLTVETGGWNVLQVERGFAVPADASDVRLSDDGDLMAWVVDEVGLVQRSGEEPLVLDEGLAAIWFPEIRGTTGGTADIAADEGDATGSRGAAVPVTTIPPTTLPSAEPVDWRALPYEYSGIDECESEVPNCTWVRHDGDGTPVSYDTVTRVLTRHSVPPVSVTLPESYGPLPFLTAVGPDDVVYLQVDPAVPAELAADLVAVTLAEGDAGRELDRWSGVVDAVGDNELVPTPAGLVDVGCCGPDTIRPDPTAEVDVEWLDRSGATVVSPDPMVRVVLDGSAITVQRTNDVASGMREWTFEPAGDGFVRGMPPITATFDGGFVAALYGTGTTIVRGWPNGDIEQAVLAGGDVTLGVALDRDGRVLVADGGMLMRVEAFADRTQRPAGRAAVDLDTGALTLPDLSGVDASWRTDPVAFAAAVGGAPEVNEIRSIEAVRQSELDWIVTETTSNVFDDSVSAVLWELVLRRSDIDGRFVFVSGTWAQACQPGRGHQQFDTAVCT